MSKSYIIRDPLALHREGVNISRGISSWKDNISVAVQLSEMLKPCLGPKGTYKLITNKFGDVVLTKDGALILDKLDFHHPVGKILKDAAKTIETTVGDGTKTAIIIIGELLKRAEGLVTNKVKISQIIDGYRFSYKIAIEQLDRQKTQTIPLDKVYLDKIFNTFFLSRNIDFGLPLTDLTIKAVIPILNASSDKKCIDINRILITKKIGKNFRDSRVINGVIINKKITHPSMPRVIKNARVALLQHALKLDEFRHLQPYKYNITIREPNDVMSFLNVEREIIEKMIEKIIAVKANVVICRRKISSMASQLLSDNGIMAIDRVLKEEDFKAIAAITGARVVSSLDDLRSDDLGLADLVKEEKVGGEKIVVIEGCKNQGGCSILLRGESMRLLDEAEHMLKDALRFMSQLVENPTLVPGGGAVEEALAVAIRRESLKYSGKEQVAMHAFANSLEKISQLLISNAGEDPHGALSELRAKHLNGEHYFGFDQLSGKVENMVKLSVMEPYKVKEQILKTAFETTLMLLRIDNSIDRRYAKRHPEELGGQ